MSNALSDCERSCASLPTSGSTVEEVNAGLDRVDSCAQALAIQAARARELAKLGQDLLGEGHAFAADCVQV